MGQATHLYCVWPVAGRPYAPAERRQGVTGVGGRGRNEQVWVRQSGTELGHACRDVVRDQTLDRDAAVAVLVVERLREEVNVRLRRRRNNNIKVRKSVIGSNIHIEVNELDSLWIVF